MIVYDEKAERYMDTAGGEVVRVSRVLDVLDPPFEGYTEEHRARGHAVHAVAQILGEGDTIEPGTLDERLLGYVEAFQKWQRQMQPAILKTETIVFNPIHRYAGRMDALVQLPNGDIFVTDFKSGRPNRRVGPQTAAYLEASDLESRMIAGRAALWLKPTGEYEWFSEDDSPALFHESDFDAFLAALSIITWRTL